MSVRGRTDGRTPQRSVAEAEAPAALLTCSRFACRSDARLHKDDTDICFSKTLNSCKVPQIRYASVERLLERLTDLRFLSIDFLNTFLHTYRIFTTATVVLAKLSDIYKRPFTSIPVRYSSLADGSPTLDEVPKLLIIFDLLLSAEVINESFRVPQGRRHGRKPEVSK